MKHRVTHKQESSKRCFICGIENDFGLKVRFFETEENELVALFTPKDEHQSYPDRMHGGMSAAVLDETIGRAINVGNKDEMVWGVTVELTMRYRHTVPLNKELRAVGRVTFRKGRLFEGEGEILLPDGTVAVSAKGKYIIVPEEKMVDPEFLDEEWGLDMPGENPDIIEY